MELLFFMLPSFLHGWLMGDFSFSETDDDRLRKPVRRGILLFNEGKVAEAFHFFCEEEEKSPKCAYLYLFRAKCHLFFENYSAAIPDLEKSLRLETTIAETYVLLADTYYKVEEYDAALAMYLRASRMYLEKNAGIERMIGELQMRKGNFESAYKNLILAQKLGDTSAQDLLQTIQNIRNKK